MTLDNDTSFIRFQKMPGGGSDKRLKKNITTIDGVLNKVTSLRPVTWHWKTDDQEKDIQYGFIAQEVERLFPHLVSENVWKDGSTRKFLTTNDMVPFLVSAIKEQQKQIDSMAKIIKRLEEQNKD